MGMRILISLLNILLTISVILSCAKGDSLVPMLCVFGDSLVDVGNNTQLNTLIKANFPPYGRDFVTHSPTGRFCNGKLATDFTAEYLGFTSYPPPYLGQKAKGKNLLTGVNFASAGSGYYNGTAQFYRAISLTQQLAYYKDYQDKVVKMVGTSKANDLLSGGIHLLSAGSSDYIQNYYINPTLYRAYNPDQLSDILMRSYSNFVQNLYNLGVRKIGVTSLPPFGCLPAAITLFGGGSNECVPRLNQDAASFNNKLNGTSINIQSKLPGRKLVMFDIYQPLLDIVTKPSDSGPGGVSSYRYDREVVDLNTDDLEAAQLHEAIDKKLLDDDRFLWIFGTRKVFQLKATFKSYQLQYGSPIYQDIKHCGNDILESVLGVVVSCIDSP